MRWADEHTAYEEAKARKLEARAKLGSVAQVLETIFDGVTSFVIQLLNSVCNQLARIPMEMWYTIVLMFMFVVLLFAIVANGTILPARG